MAGPGTAQPIAMPHLRFRFDSIVALEAGAAVESPSTIIRAGNTFTLRMDFGFDGDWVGWLHGDTFNVFHHVENVETAAKQDLYGGTFAVPPPGAAAHILVTSGPYTTSDTGGTGQLQIPGPPGAYASGTFRILTHVHAVNPHQQNIAAYHDGLILMVTKP